MKHRRPPIRWACIALGVLSILGGMILAGATSPTFSDAVVTREDGSVFETTFPVTFENEIGSVQIRFTMETKTFGPSLFQIIPDDCLDGVEVNGTVVPNLALPVCDYNKGLRLPLGDLMQGGENSMMVSVRNTGGRGGVQIAPAFTDPIIAIAWTARLLGIVLLGIGIAWPLLLRLVGTPLLSLLLLGTVLRISYLIVTPPMVRGHDADAHIDYIAYLFTHWMLPAPSAGWEFWQPPLYYAVSALWVTLETWFGMPLSQALHDTQLLTLGISFGTLLAGFWCVLLTFPAKSDGLARAAMASVLAVVPTLIFSTVRVSNDTLAIFVSFIAIGCLLYWWKSGRMRSWVAMSIAIGIGLLTKDTVLPLIPIAGLLLLHRKNMRWKTRIVAALILIVICLASAGPQILRKMRGGAEDILISNAHQQSDLIRIGNKPGQFLLFSPAGMLVHPYNDPWKDSERRQYFWETMFRSAFTGEFSFGADRKNLVRSMLALGLLLFVGAVMGMWRALKNHVPNAAPFFLLAVIYVLSEVVLRIRYPYASVQDIRYILPVFLSVGFGIGVALMGKASSAFRTVLLHALIVEVGLCMAFTLSL